MQFTMFEEITGRIVMAMEVPAVEDALANLLPGHLLIEGRHDGETHDIAGGNVATPRPIIPEPVRDGHPLSRAAPPEVRVHDPWIQPPHPLVDTSLSAPGRGLCPVEGGDCRIELSATFPWLPRGMAVRL